MSFLKDRCDEVRAVARGDERDDVDTKAHIAACEPCREAVEDFRQLATAARSALSTDALPSTFAVETASRARFARSDFAWTRRFAFMASAAAAALLIVSLQVNPTTSPLPAVSPVADSDIPATTPGASNTATRNSPATPR